MYLVHGIVFCSLIDKLPIFQVNLSNFTIGVVAILLSFFGTIIVHDFIERPIQKFLTEKIIDI